MSLDDRFGWIILGCIIGYVVGRIQGTMRANTRQLQAIKEELDEVDEIVKDHERHHDEHGFMTFMNAALVVVLVLTVYAAFSSGKAVNDVKKVQVQQAANQAALEDAQARLDAVVACTQKILSKAVVALNERTTYSTEQSRANVDLQKSQSAFFKILLHKPPYSQQRRDEAVQQYFSDLTAFLDVSKAQAVKVAENSYPTDEELSSCLDAALKAVRIKETK